MIPLFTPTIRGNEWKYIKECLDTNWVSSAGSYVDLFEHKIAEFTGAKYAVSCVNGTSALQLSLILSGVNSGDEVIVPTLTFIAPVNAIAYNNAIPLFIGADKFFNINIEATIEFIKTKTIYKNGFSYNKDTKNKISAIIPVHIWGNAVLLDELSVLCNERNIAIIEDSSESLGTYYLKGKFKGQHTGTIGKCGCLSFNGNKIITTGGGGAILTNDRKIAEKAKYLTTQAKDDPIRYIHNEVGYNFRMTNIQAALGVAQLEQLPSFLKFKKEIYNEYNLGISKIKGISLADTPNYSNNNHWMNLVILDAKKYGEDKTSLMNRLNNSGVQTRPVWTLNHMQKPYNNCFSYALENSNDLVNNSLCIPSSANLTKDEINQVILHLNA